MTYVLDTDTMIVLLRGLKAGAEVGRRTRAQRVLTRIRRRQQAGASVGVSAITRAELAYVAAKCSEPLREQRALAKILAPLELFDFTAAAAAVAYGPARAALEHQGRPIGAMDTLIAAHALALEAVLVTANTEHFRRVSGLAVEDWAAP